MSNFSSLYGNVCNYSFANRYSASLWSRFQPPDYNTTQFTPEQISERRKCEILKYKTNTTQSTKKQRFAAASRGSLLKKRGFASQTDTLTNPNTANLPEVNGDFICPSSSRKCKLTTESDVPGPPRLLCLDENVPLYNSNRVYEYKAGQVIQSRIPTTALTAPNNVTIVSGNKSLVVSWLPPDRDSNGLYGGYALAGYLLAYSTDRTNWTNISSIVAQLSSSNGYVSATTLTYTINNLVNNTLYYVKIYSVNTSTPTATSSSTSTFPAIASATTFMLPSKPLDFSVVGDTTATTVSAQGGSASIDKTNLIAKWRHPFTDGGTPVLSYRVQYSPNKITWTTLEATIGTNDLSFDSTSGLYTYRFSGENNQGLNELAILTKSTYYVRVSAVNIVVRDDGFASPFSPTLSVKTLNSPSTVTGVTLSSGTQIGVVLLAWNPPEDNGGNAIQTYAISYYKTVDSLKSILFTTTTTATKYTITGLDSDNQYYTFSISASNGTYVSTPYQITGRANTVPGKPVGLRVSVSNMQFILSFVIDDSGGSAITSYVIGVSKNNSTWDNFEYAPINTQSVGSIQLNLSTALLAAGSRLRPTFETKIPYYFRVASRNALFPLLVGIFTTTDVIGKIIVIPNSITNIEIAEETQLVDTISPTTGIIVSTSKPYLLITWWWTGNGGGPTTVVSDDIGGDDENNVGYILEFSETVGREKIWIKFNTTANLIKDRSIKFTYIKPGTNYYFRVYAVNSVGSSVASGTYDYRTASSTST